MRIGIFGGTFDPLHHGHIHAIAYALDSAHLDVCRVMVAGQPWQKDGNTANASWRLKMVRESCAQYFGKKSKSVIVDDREITRGGPTYTVDTLREHSAEFPDAQLVLIVGEDIPAMMSTWKDAEDINHLAEIFVVPRSIFPTSSSYIRSSVQAKKPITGLLPPAIEAEILSKSMYNTDT